MKVTKQKLRHLIREVLADTDPTDRARELYGILHRLEEDVLKNAHIPSGTSHADEEASYAKLISSYQHILSSLKRTFEK